MQKLLLESVLQPLLLRVGSLTAGALIGLGMASQHGPSVQAAVSAVGLLAFDLIARKWVKK